MMYNSYASTFDPGTQHSQAQASSSQQQLSPESIQYLTQLEQTILHAASTGSPESSHRLDVERCNTVDGLAGACLELLRRRGWGCGGNGSMDAVSAQHDAVTFYALTTLQRSPVLSCLPPPNNGICNNSTTPTVATTTTEIGAKLSQNFEQFASLQSQLRQLLLTTLSHPPSLLSMPHFIATKVAVLLALLVRELYPMRWSCPWKDILNALHCENIINNNNNVTSSLDACNNGNTNSGSSTANSQSNNINIISKQENLASMEMYLRFLDGISDEIVYPAASFHNTDQEASNPSSATLPHSTVISSNFQYVAMRREQVKDALRGFPLKSTGSGDVAEPCIPLEHTDTAHIVGWLLDVITVITSSNPAANLTAATSNNTASDLGPQDENNSLLEIAVRAAATVKRYLSWIDLRLATHPKLVQCLLDGMRGADEAKTNNDIEDDDDDLADANDCNQQDDSTPGTLLAVECALCLREVVTRGMDEQKKVVLMMELNVFGTLCCLSRLGGGSMSGNGQHPRGKLDLITLDATQIDAVIAAAELINTAGLEFIPGWEVECQSSPTSSSSSLTQPVNLLMNQCVELALACLAYDDIDVSGAVVDLVSRILVSLEKKEGCWNNNCINIGNNNGDTTCNTLVSRVLSILHLRMKYPSEFQFDYEDEDEAEEEMYRTHLRKLYQRIVRFRPQLAIQFMGSCLSSLSQPLSMTSPADMEVALRLVHHFGEGRRPAPGSKTALRDAPFREIVTALHRSDVASHPHREVLLLYYDLSVRYSLVLKELPELLSGLLGALTGNRGLQHPHPRVRSRCCYFLLRLVKAVGGKVMRTYVEVVVEGIQTLLRTSLSDNQERNIFPIPPNDALYLFETTGILLGTTGLDADLQQRCTTAVLTPHIQSIEQTLNSPDLNNDLEHYGEQLSISISAIAQLSKGWQNHPPPEVQAVLVAAVDVCRNVLVALPSSTLVRNRTAVLLQRMILCLGERILPTMPEFLGVLLAHCTGEEDVLDISQLIMQLCIKFKQNAVPAVDVAILPFLQKVLAMQIKETTVIAGGKDGVGNSNIGDPTLPPHLLTEQLSIRKHAFASLQHIAAHNVSMVLCSERNVHSMGDILRLMNDGATVVPDPVMKKSCTSFFSELIEQWGSSSDATNASVPTQVINGFFDFVYDVFVPEMIRCFLGDTFNVKDALYSRTLSEFGNALWFLKQSCRGRAEFDSRVVEAIIFRGNNGSVSGFNNASNGKDMELCLKVLKQEVSGR